MSDNPENNTDLLRLPAGLSAPDPVEGNPYPPGTQLHEIWKDATKRAEQKIHLFNAAYLDARREHERPNSPEEARRLVLALQSYVVTGQFDIWAERGVNVVWSDACIQPYEKWLATYANAFLRAVKDFFPPEVGDTGWLIAELRVRLIARIEFWKSEARRYVDEQKKHSASSAGLTTKPSKKRAPHPKPPCFVPAAKLLRENPQLSVLDFCRRMDSKAEQYPNSAKYLPPEKWKVRSFYDQYKKRSNTVSAFLARVRKELPTTEGG